MNDLRACVVGVGHLGRHHVRILSELPGVELVALVELNESLGRAMADRLGCAWRGETGDLAEQVDFAVIAVPTIHHRECALPFLQAGKAVLIEKPMAPDPETCRQILADAEAGGAMVGVGHVERFNPAVRRAMELGIQPRFIEAHRLAPYSFRSADVGVILDLMIHDLDLVCAWTGELPESVDAVGGKTLSSTEDICSARLRFPSGAVANLTASRLSLKPMRRFRVFGPDSYISVDSQEGYALLVQKASNFDEEAVARAAQSENPAAAFQSLLHSEELSLDDDEPLRAELCAFMEAVGSGQAHEVSGEDGLRAVEIAQRVSNAMGDSCWEA